MDKPHWVFQDPVVSIVTRYFLVHEYRPLEIHPFTPCRAVNDRNGRLGQSGGFVTSTD